MYCSSLTIEHSNSRLGFQLIINFGYNVDFIYFQFAIGSLMDDYLGENQLSFIFKNLLQLFLFTCLPVVFVAGLVS